MNKHAFVGGLSLGVVLGVVLAVVIREIVTPPPEQRNPTVYLLDTNEHTRIGPALEYIAPEVMVLGDGSQWPDAVRSATRTNGVWRHLGGGRYLWNEETK